MSQFNAKTATIAELVRQSLKNGASSYGSDNPTDFWTPREYDTHVESITTALEKLGVEKAREAFLAGSIHIPLPMALGMGAAPKRSFW
jgi:hypothetical protein